MSIKQTKKAHAVRKGLFVCWLPEEDSVTTVETSGFSLRNLPDLLKKIDQVAREESRSRSELIREAARGYIERKRRWKQIFNFGKMSAASKRMTESDIDTEIASYRREKE